jgi:hypothetical protein
MLVPVRTIRVWINAFIPQHIPRWTRPVPQPDDDERPNATMIPSSQPDQPGTAVGYFTDQRGFSNALDAPSQVHSEAYIDLTGPKPLLAQWHECRFTTPVDGPERPKAALPEDPGQLRFLLLPHRSLIRDPAIAKLVGTMPWRGSGPSPAEPIHVHFCGEAELPLVGVAEPLTHVAYSGILRIDRDAQTIEARAMVSRFPAFEMYAAVNEGPGRPIFRLFLPRGSAGWSGRGRTMRAIGGQCDLG